MRDKETMDREQIFRNVVASLFVQYEVSDVDAEFLTRGFCNDNLENLAQEVDDLDQKRVVWRIANWANLEERV